jgi:hypothetical protein
VCVCVCVCERERERDGDGLDGRHSQLEMRAVSSVEAKHTVYSSVTPALKRLKVKKKKGG